MTVPSTAFVVALTGMTYAWEPACFNDYNLHNQTGGKIEQTATGAELVFGSNSIETST